MFENRNKLLVLMMILVIFTLQACSTNSGLGENNKVETNGEGKISDKDKTVLTYGCYRLTGTSAENAVKEQMIHFMQENPEYMIEIKEYGADGVGFMDAYNRMNTEIAAGKGPDIIDLDYSQFEMFAEKEILADLNPYLMAASSLQRSNYNEAILALYERKGKLWAIPPAYSCATAIGKTSVVGNEPGWTLEEMISLAEQQPDGVQMYSWPTKDAFLFNCVNYNLANFIDWNKGNCFFDGEKFIELLKLSNRYLDNREASSSQDSASITNDLQENEILLYEGFLFGGLGSYLMARQMFGEEITLIGYPSPQGVGARLIPQVLLGINSASGNIDASWEFVSSFLTREFQLSYTHLSTSPAYPLMKEALDKVLEDELAPNPYASEIPAQEDKEAVKSFLETANYLVLGEREQVVGQIIGEEAPSYWEGNKTAEETAAAIQNRVQNYLSERE